MRKDVKIGLGIGGVLLAVLIVYLLVPKTDGTRQYSQNENSTIGGDGSPESARPTNPQESTPIGGTNSVETPQVAPETSAPTPRRIENIAADTETDTQGERVTGVDWTKILETGIVQAAPLMATRRPEPDDPFGETQKAPVDRGPEPVWPGGTSTQPPAASSGGNGATNQIAGQAAQAPTTPAGRNGIARTGITEHVVQQNETLSSIALAVYGDARYYKEILKANPTLDERKMRPGTKLKIPDAATFKQAQTAEHRLPAAAVDGKSEYRVVKDDNLTRIAVKLYGKPGRANELYELNKDRIGPDSSRLKLGMVLKLPEAPTNSVSTR